jgi:putative DNA primase/helicase
MFEGYPLTPAGDASKCSAILDLLAELCGHERDYAHDVFTWLLRWIAYPLQHPGAKMQSAVLMFGEKQGTGKSLFWEGVVKALYGEYGTTAGQHQLDSAFTEWRSCKTFVVFEEVLSRSERYNFIGTIKHMITGRTQRINPKGLPEREESNHMNSVFLSNEPQPIPLELEDRRFMVVEARNKLTEELKRAVLSEIANGGLSAFYQYLLRFDLADFEPGTPVLRTVAREKIVNFGLPSHEAFFREWQSEELRAPKSELIVPFCSCQVSDLFDLYRHWCNRVGERLITQTKFSELMANRVTKGRASILIGTSVTQRRVFIANPPQTSIAYGLSVSDQCEKFRSIAGVDA